MWPKLADALGLEFGPPLPRSLQDVMSDKEPLWDAMVAKHGLAPHPFADVSKARRYGFHEHVQTERMSGDLIDEFRAHRIIP